MKLYLSSYGLGNDIGKLLEMLDRKTKTAVIMAAQDFSEEPRRSDRLAREISDLEALGLRPEEFDLRQYFHDNSALEADLTSYDFVWVRGGNVFVLRQAMALSGLDKLLPKLIEEDKFVYGGYSAGVCVLGPTLRGLELVDPLNRPGIGYPISNILWDGLGVLPYAFAPHYKSDHPESADIEKYIEYMDVNGIPYKTLSDGKVLIVDTDVK